MSEEEIRALAELLGLNPKLLVLFEPRRFDHDSIKAREYRLQYRAKELRHDFKFLVFDDEMHIEEDIVKFHVHKALHLLVEKTR